MAQLDDFDQNYTKFLTWLNAVGGIISPKIRIVDIRGKGKGPAVVSSDTIDQNEILFSIPRRIILSVENSELSTKHPGVLEPVADDPWLSLVLTMMYEKASGDASMWKAYFDVLPTEFDSLIWWSPQEIAELQASAVVGRIGRADADRTFRERLLPVVRAHPALFGLEDQEDKVKMEDIVLHETHVIASTIMAFAFDVEPANRDVDEDGYVTDENDADLPKGMIPLADILNADADRNNVRLFYENDTLEMKALKFIGPGEEIYDDHGQLPRSDLLRHYGYVTHGYAKYDVVDIPTSLFLEKAKELFGISEEVLKKRLSRLFESEEDVPDGFVLARPESENFSISELSEEFLIRLILQESNNENKSSIFDNWRKWFLNVLQSRLSGYLTTLQEDRELLYQSKRKSLSRENHRKVMAIEVRIGEKEILTQAILKLETLEHELVDTEPPKKKLKM